MSALRDLANVFVEARRYQVDALNKEGFSQQEYSWVRQQVFEAAGMEVANMVDLTQLERAVRDGTGVDDFSAPKMPQPDVPAKNRELVKPYMKQFDEWLPLAFFGLIAGARRWQTCLDPRVIAASEVADVLHPGTREQAGGDCRSCAGGTLHDQRLALRQFGETLCEPPKRDMHGRREMPVVPLVVVANVDHDRHLIAAHPRKLAGLELRDARQASAGQSRHG